MTATLDHHITLFSIIEQIAVFTAEVPHYLAKMRSIGTKLPHSCQVLAIFLPDNAAIFAAFLPGYAAISAAFLPGYVA